jgi:hypothetical protein
MPCSGRGSVSMDVRVLALAMPAEHLGKESVFTMECGAPHRGISSARSAENTHC